MRHRAVIVVLLSAVVWLGVGAAPALAAVSSGGSKKLESAAANQGGGRATTSRYKQQSSVGDAVAAHRLSGSRYRIVPGFIGATASTTQATNPTDLDITVLYAKTGPVGTEIAAQTWQRDQDPIFIWEAPPNAPDVAGYSFAIDEVPDDVVDTSGTSHNVATSALLRLADGKRTFSVKALNTAGNSGTVRSFDIWVDTTPPAITAYTPSPGALLNSTAPPVTATVSDGSSGVPQGGVRLFLNGAAAPVTLHEATGLLTLSGGTWREGPNSLELRVEDLVGNALAPLVWSVTVDTEAPVGTFAINAGATMTTSVHVTLNLSASDNTSGVTRMLVSNEEASGYVEEPYVTVRELWRLTAIRGTRQVYVKFADGAGNISAPVTDTIDLGLLSPDTVLTGGPAGFSPDRSATFRFLCPEEDCVFAYAFDHETWSAWNASGTATMEALVYGNHYFRVKAAKEVNGTPGIQADEEDPSPAERTWVVGVEPQMLTIPKGPPIKLWRLE